MHLLRAPGQAAIRVALGAGVISLALIAAGQLGPTGSGSPNGEPLPPTDLSDAVAAVFASRDCVHADEASALIGDALTQLDFADWSVDTAASVRPDKCVGAGFLVRDRLILLMPAVSPALHKAIDALQERLLVSCYGEIDARQLVSEALAQADETGWQINTDGPVGGPVDRFDEIMRHIDAGCYVYTGTGWTAQGVRMIYLTGKR